MVRRGLVRLALVIFVASAIAAEKQEQVAGHGAAQLFRGPQNHLLVPASVNGHPATFLLDTGENLTFLQKNRAAPLGVQSLGRQTHVGALWFSQGQIDHLDIGSLSFPSVEVALYDPAQFRGPVPGQGGKAADGIIGLDFLQHHGAVINCRTQQLFLRAESNARLDLAGTTGGLGFTRVPISSSGHGQLTVPCSVGNVSGRLVIDTGAFVTIFDQSAVRSLNLKEDATKQSARTASGKVRPLSLAQINDFKIGSVAIAPQKFVIMDLFSPAKPVRVFTPGLVNRLEYYDGRMPKSKNDILGLLGSELLYQRSAIIDLGSMSLFLK